MKINPYGLLLIALILAPWALILWLFWPRAEVILYDAGGPVAARAALVEHGEPAQIVGICMSACTMHMANGCVSPGATLVFHGPSRNGVPLSPSSFDHWSRVMARHYPPAIAAWFMAQGRYGEWAMTGAEAIRLGATPCARPATPSKP